MYPKTADFFCFRLSQAPRRRPLPLLEQRPTLIQLMSKHPIHLGIIGCGSIAKAHVNAAKENGFAITCVSDISEQAITAFLEQHLPEARGFTNAEELLDQGAVDAVIICTPPCSHTDVAIAALQRGIHVFCEKPLAANVKECRRIEAAANASNATLMMAFRHRFTAAQQAIKARLDTGELGRVILFQNVFGGPARQMKDRWFSRFAISGGGTLMDTSIHSIDLFRHYCGEIATFSGERDRAFEGTDVEDSSVLSLRSESGALGIIAASWNYGVGRADMEIITENGRIVYDYMKPTVYHIYRPGQPAPESISVKATGGFTEQLAHFVESTRCGTAPLTGIQDGLRAVEIVEGVYQQRPLKVTA